MTLTDLSRTRWVLRHHFPDHRNLFCGVEFNRNRG